MKKRKAKHKNKNKMGFKVCILLGIMILFSVFLFKNNEDYTTVDLENVEALKISSSMVKNIKNLATKYEIDFSELFTYYAFENNFFENKIDIDDKIEQNILLNYDNIKSKYKQEYIEKYFTLIDNIYKDIKCFPIDEKYKQEYIFGDSFGSERNYGGERTHKGCDIMDKENIKGRIPIISMTDGKISNIDWNEQGGYNIGVTSNNGNYYYYAHFHTFNEKLKKGDEIKAMEVLGYMGNSGYGKEGTIDKFPVHLHIGICPKTDLSTDDIWINPYPFLSLVENDEKQDK